MATTNSKTKEVKSPDKYELFLKYFNESNGSMTVACQKSGITMSEGFVFMAGMGQEKNKEKIKDPDKVMMIGGSKDDRILALLTKMSELTSEPGVDVKKDELYLRYSQEYSKLMGHYDNVADLGYLEELTGLLDKLQTIFPDQVLANIAYDMEELVEIQGGVTVEDEDEIYEIS